MVGMPPSAIQGFLKTGLEVAFYTKKPTPSEISVFLSSLSYRTRQFPSLSNSLWYFVMIICVNKWHLLLGIKVKSG